MSSLVRTLLVLTVVLLAGCNKKLSDIFDRNGKTLVVDDVEFDYLSAKAKIDFESEKNSLSGSANIRIQRDSVIWMSLSPGLGIEVARVLITTDSVAVIDKVNKQYMQYHFADLSEKFDFELNYQLVQSAILGNLIYPYDKERVVRSPQAYTYRQQHGPFAFENFIGAKTMKLEKVQVRDTVSNNSFSVNYSDFQLVEEEVFPYQIMAKLTTSKEKGNTEVQIAYKQTSIEKKPLKFPFNVPQRYERK
ncbi:DUF4292 domain-containing protein [Marinoscillum furvescens]|uniref:Uncharacterized protein DUF4292 n=1 Tax=Marinoscillum furvescens DSM 4134 TaxID=1122208 RepID=A0A3D9LHB2_MARFU|nr:DUF4292 domain-containing protein [Marinoscillum furvescens]REE05988.1 uncharacterized protein DUF4292 [Marinoscillum furvescens DSM 4134]